MTPTEIEFLINSFNKIYSMFSEAVRELKRGSEQLVYKDDKEAYTKTGLGRRYWERIKYRIPYIDIPPATDDGIEKRVYPIDALKRWLEENTIYPDKN